jgi:tetratricopeptide (TPR) repeat protein
MFISRRSPILAMAVLLTMLACPLSAQTTSDHIRSMIAADKLDEALNTANEELEKDKDNVTLLFLKGLILTRLNRLDQAEKIFKRLTREHPELPEPYNNLAVIYAARGDFNKARDALQEAINTHPSYATAHENLGDIYAKMASQAYSQALQLDKENTTAKTKLSLINDLFSQPKTAPAVVASVKSSGTPAGTATTAAEANPPVKETAASSQEGVTQALATTERPKEAVTKAQETMAPSQQAAASPQEAVPQHPAVGVNREEAVAQIKQAIDAWSKAWSDQDVNAYLSYYGQEFNPPSNETRKQWMKNRRKHLSAPSFIRVGISDLEVQLLGPDHAQATFTQEYQSDTYGDRVTKLLLFAREGGDWRIVQEATK